jgi:2,3-bisphosphoglycerate-dependent phosphoglycerate mutase
MRKYIIAVRHAQSMTNAGLVTKTPESVDLTDLGREQSRKAADTIHTIMGEEQPQLFVVSNYIRTQQTLEPTKERYPNVPIEKWKIHEFCMLNPKFFSNTSQAQRRPFVVRYWKNNDPHHCEGGRAECFIDFVTRIENMVSKLQTHKANNIIVFSHCFVLNGINFLKTRTNFKPLKDSPLDFQREIMRDFRTYCDEHEIPNATPYRLDL